MLKDDQLTGSSLACGCGDTGQTGASRLALHAADHADRFRNDSLRRIRYSCVVQAIL